MTIISKASTCAHSSFDSSSFWASLNNNSAMRFFMSVFPYPKYGEVKEGANKQVISSQADSLIKISRIWADFFPANTSNQPI
ncbi:hypothetical protein AWP73_09790 [Escherichia coli]|nr:hypothetical protein AWP73_09790 [Escherichia coli]